MSELKRTVLRHRLLVEVAADKRSIYRGLQWTVIHRDGTWCSSQEARASRDLQHLIRSRAGTYGSNISEAELTEEGKDVLAHWNAKHGEPS